MKTLINLDSIVRRNEKIFLDSSLGDETMLLNQQTGDYVNLNAAATYIWINTASAVKVETIVTELIKTFDVSRQQCEVETLECVDKMIEQTILLTL